MPNAPLLVGMYGADVTRLQDFLRQSGFELPASEVERSFFGPSTRQALRDFQQQNGLPVTGALDERTAGAVNMAPTSINGNQPIPEATVPARSGPVTRPAMRGIPVSSTTITPPSVAPVLATLDAATLKRTVLE